MASLARKITIAEIQHLINQAETIQVPLQQERAKKFYEGNAFTIISSATYGYKLNRTEGFGMAGPVTKNDLLAIEKVWKSSQLQPELHLCEYADVTAFDLLSGYSETGRLCSFHFPLHRFERLSIQSNPDTTIAESKDVAMFVNASVEGFSSNGRPKDLLLLLAESAAQRPDTRLFVASIDGKLAGTAGMAVFDVDGENFANLYIDSTQPAFRGRGVHQALLLARLNAAKESGCDHAIASARANSGSARNIEKAGFDRAFSSTTYQKLLSC